VEVALGLDSPSAAHIQHTAFQSLFSWKSPSDLLRILWKSEVGVFQSLFSWKSPSDGVCICFYADALEGFNPCFRGSRPRTAMQSQLIYSCTPNVSILVFVEVALGRDVFGQVAARCMSFNPCFRGSRPRTVDLSDPENIAAAFQSLFSWKSPSDHKGSWPLSNGRQVSILVFVEVALGQLDRMPRCSFRGVSILVFVEVALGLCLGCLGEHLGFEFQSLFSWKSPSD